jgi:ribosome maturation factor RimP
MAKLSIAEKVDELLRSTVEGLGYVLWDVEFVREGTERILRITIDSENGIGIEDCETVHHAIDPIIDEADPIDCSYSLQVSSPGLERDLKTDFHYLSCIGEEVELKLFAPIDGKKTYRGVLESYDDGVIVLSDNSGQHSFEKASVSKAQTVFNF